MCGVTAENRPDISEEHCNTQQNLCRLVNKIRDKVGEGKEGEKKDSKRRKKNCSLVLFWYSAGLFTIYKLPLRQ